MRVPKPTGSFIWVQRSTVEAKSEGGIHLPTHMLEQPNEGRIVFVGPDVKVREVGELVMFPGYAGTELEFEKEKYLSMKEEDVLAVISTD